MKRFLLVLLFVLSFKLFYAQSQLVIGDCTVTYLITGSNAETNENLAGTTKTLYIKGKMSRIDMVGNNYKQSVVYDNETGAAVILKEIGAEKYKSTFTSSEWKKQNKQFEGLTVTLTTEAKTILGYECKKAVAHLKDGSYYNVYYAPAIIPSANENPYQFKDIPGLVLQYEIYGNKNSSGNFASSPSALAPAPLSTAAIWTSGTNTMPA